MELERRLERLENSAPSVAAALLDASDKLHRASARWERSTGRAARNGDGDADDQELDELLTELRSRR